MKYIELTHKANFTFGQYAQLENVPASLVDLQNVASETKEYDGKKAMNFCLLCQVIRLAGSIFGGRIPLFMFRPFFDAIESLQPLADGASPIEVYEKRLNSTGDALKVEDELTRVEAKLQVIHDKISARFQDFDEFRDGFRRAFLRLAKYGRYIKKCEGSEALLKAFLSLEPCTVLHLIEELCAHTKGGKSVE